MSVYLIHAVGTDFIKIGYAVNAKRRISHIATCSPFSLDILAIRDGNRNLEYAMHHALKERRVRGEWFNYWPSCVTWFCDFDIPPIPDRDRTHRDILKAAGHDVIAALTERPITTVRSWDQRDSIPATEWRALIGANIATADELLDGVSPRGAAA